MLESGADKSRLEASSRCWATVFGPVATVGWLRETLAAEGHGDEALLKPGAVVICSTPGGLCALHIYMSCTRRNRVSQMTRLMGLQILHDAVLAF